VTGETPRVPVASAAALRDWLEADHAQPGAVWLVTAKTGHEGHVPREAVLDELLCFGWIDGRRMRLDAVRTMQLISPRRHDRWTATYRARFARLEAEGRMRPPGRAAADRARAAGLWEALPDVDALAVPDDLAAALAARPSAGERFAASAPSYRRNVLRWIALARRPETRARRVGQTACAAAQGERVPQM
jgi:uncharacterized protein YdeI (YjbR/CyaY-like superfamily)